MLGLVIGSFLNVVIYRLPIMLEREWQREINSATEDELANSNTEKAFNLMTPNSRCSQCEAPIKAWQNIPVISYLPASNK